MKLTTLASLLIISLPLFSNAQASRTWVSGVGDDANPCSRTAPGKTFAGAITKTAPGGVIDVLDPGGFGAVTITNSITIDGDAAEGGVLVSGTAGIVINAGPNGNVTLRNLSFEGLGTGTSAILILSAGSVHIEDCRINGFADSGINYANSAANGLLFVKDTIIHNCVSNGVALTPSTPCTITLENVNITDCGDGIDAGPGSTSLVSSTTVSGNGNIGVRSTGGIVRLSHATITGNGADGVKATLPGRIESYHNNIIIGNNPDGRTTSFDLVK